MWGEHHRLLPQSADNPHGEDSLRTKLDQLQWICADTPVQWQLYAVDDGCPHGSAKIAQEIAAAHPLAAQVHILRLQDALPASEGALKELASADDSRKAGAIIQGCEAALASDVDAVNYTDAGNSVHLGQFGLLLQPFLDDNARRSQAPRCRAGQTRSAILVSGNGVHGHQVMSGVSSDQAMHCAPLIRSCGAISQMNSSAVPEEPVL